MTDVERTILSNRFVTALQYAFEAHATQRRKGTTIPYISHLLSVASLVLEDGGTEVEAIAALLHDAAEDQGGEARLEDIRRRFGSDVTEIVDACTDSLTEDPNKKARWSDRKRDYVHHLKMVAPNVLRVSCADKLHNARCILVDLRTHGPDVWERFTSSGDKTPAQILGYYHALSEVFTERLPGALPRELNWVVTTLSVEAGITPDMTWI